MAKQTENTLDLWILDSASPNSAVVCAQTADDLSVTTVAFDDHFRTLLTTRTKIHEELRGGATNRLTQAELESFGNALFDFVIRDDIRTMYNRLDSDVYLRLHIFSNLPQVQQLPWEFMQVPDQGYGPNLNRPVARIVPTIGFSPGDMRRRKSNEKLNALFVSAEPVGERLQPVSWETVETALRESLAAGPIPFSVESLIGATKASLSKKVSQREYHIVHFSGHGAVRNGEGFVILEDGNGGPDYVDATSFAGILGRRGVRLVVLAACETSSGDFHDDFSVVASALVRREIPAVVANQAAVPQSTAADFARTFYEELVRSGDVDRAVSETRTMLAYALGGKNRVALEWGIPTVYRHIRSSKVFR